MDEPIDRRARAVALLEGLADVLEDLLTLLGDTAGEPLAAPTTCATEGCGAPVVSGEPCEKCGARTVRVDLGPLPAGRTEIEFPAPVVVGPDDAIDAAAVVVERSDPAPMFCPMKGCGTILLDGACPRCSWPAGPPSPPSNRGPAPTADTPISSCPMKGCSTVLVDGACPRCGWPAFPF
jgi:hypothetical protein